VNSNSSLEFKSNNSTSTVFTTLTESNTDILIFPSQISTSTSANFENNKNITKKILKTTTKGKTTNTTTKKRSSSKTTIETSTTTFSTTTTTKMTNTSSNQVLLTSTVLSDTKIVKKACKYGYSGTNCSDGN
jgi:hypothetical protein